MKARPPHFSVDVDRAVAERIDAGGKLANLARRQDFRPIPLLGGLVPEHREVRRRRDAEANLGFVALDASICVLKFDTGESKPSRVEHGIVADAIGLGDPRKDMGEGVAVNVVGRLGCQGDGSTEPASRC